MSSLLPLIALAVWLASAVWFVALCAAESISSRRQRRANASQESPGWVNAPDAPHLTLVDDEPGVAQIINFPTSHQGGAA